MPTVDLPQGALQAWVLFDATIPSITDSFNVSSITDDGTGQFTVNYSITMADTDYHVHVCGDDAVGSDLPAHYENGHLSGRTTTVVEVDCFAPFGSVFLDVPLWSVSIMGNAAAATARDLPQGAAVAWVNFDASTGTPTINDGLNVASLTDSGVGSYVVNLTTALSNANYTVAVTIDDNAQAWAARGIETSTVSRTSSSLPILTFDYLSGTTDPDFVSVVFYGDAPTTLVRDLPASCAQVWASWNQTGTLAILDSFNVSSITDEGVGWAEINFTQAFLAADFAMVTTMDGNGDQFLSLAMETQGVGNGGFTPRGTTSFAVRGFDLAGGFAVDSPIMNAAAYGRI